MICHLSTLGVGCHWRHLFVGCLCYADDVVLLAPSIDALHRMLQVCTSFADDYGLRFNPTRFFSHAHFHILLQIPLSFLVVCHYLLRIQFSTLATFCLVICVTLLILLGLLRIWFLRQTACLQHSHVQTHWLNLIYIIHCAYYSMVHPCGGYPAKL